jgi:hypothetical protein
MKKRVEIMGVSTTLAPQNQTKTTRKNSLRKKLYTARNKLAGKNIFVLLIKRLINRKTVP